MPTDEKQPPQEPPGDTPDEIRALFKTCELKQKAVCRASFDKGREWLVREMTFSRSQFPRRPEGEASSEDAPAWYQEMVKQLKAAPNETLWYWFAKWLRSEGIREPEDFLPNDVYKKLTKDARERLGGCLSVEYYNSYLVRIWLPYIEPLLRKAKWLRQRKPPCNVKRELERNGFNPKILAVLEGKTKKNWTSAVEFTCAWVARKGGSRDAEGLRNAYSQVFGRRMLRGIKCSFCEKPSINEFWAYTKPVPHCAEHGADQLPKLESSALPDRMGRRWWREDLNLRCTVSGVSP